MTKPIAIIPARSGSKRLPLKNVKIFHGKPIIYYSIKAALESKLFNRVIVSTDSLEFKKISEELGAEVPFLRSKVLSDDYTTLTDVFIDALSQLKDQGSIFDEACLILATAPFIQVEHLQETYKLLKERALVKGVVPVTTFPYPIMRSLKMNSDQTIQMNWPEYELTRSNDLEESLHDIGQFYWVRVGKFLGSADKKLLSSGCLGYPIPRYLVQDIDSQDDWDRAELMYKSLMLSQQ